MARLPVVDIRLGPEPLSVAAADARVTAPDWGGRVCFAGAVRAQNRGRQVVAIHYEAYGPMATRVLAEIGDEAHQRFDVGRLAIHHRIGRLVVGDLAVVVAAGAVHRDAAFLACRYAIDELKKRAPIWKKECYTDGEAWVSCTP